MMAKHYNNLSAVLLRKGVIEVQQTALPENPGENEVLLEIHSVGVCGSDVHFWNEGKIGKYEVNKPIILGHEASATVVEIGENVTHLKVGDRVAIEPSIPCRRCNLCKNGNYHLCDDIYFMATPPNNGALTRYLKHAADFCFKLPHNVSTEEGALIEPLSVAVHACNRAGVTVGDNVLVCGAGPIGLVCMLAAKAFGASKVCITDVNEKRLEFAKSLGAELTILTSETNDENSNLEALTKYFGDYASVTIECTGAESSTAFAIKATKTRGKIQLVGLGGDEVKVPLIEVIIREINVKGCLRYRSCYPQALDLVSSGKVDLKPLITDRYNLLDTAQAFERAKSGKGIKVMIKCSSD